MKSWIRTTSTSEVRTLSRILFFLSLAQTFLVLLPLEAYDLSKVRMEKLENGLTVLVLEDHSQPLVSTQVLYKVGGRNECTGTTGLAHFVEHMAFRSTQNFPDTQDAIYAVGGEWHGYTWIDQTTYFETVPVEHLDHVLRLQADRMINVMNRKEEVDAERGAILTELHGYENDPASVLYDQVLATSFMQHPYRFNVIGWTSDVEKITHDDLVQFYKRFYTPSNAVLAIAGDVETEKLLDDVRQYFGGIESSPVETLPRTEEPLQKGERRVYLRSKGRSHYFQITYRAPAASDPDYSAFLLIQGMLAGSNGVSFRQSGFSVPVAEGTRLHGIGKSISTFMAATAQPYVFNIVGQADTQPDAIEKEIERRVAEIREKQVSGAEMQKAKDQLLSELVFDIETTEDAAHQLAYFEGVGAFDVLQELPQLISKVSESDIQRVAQKFLLPEQRTIGWVLGENASQTSAPAPTGMQSQNFPEASPRKIPSTDSRKVFEKPVVKKLKGGVMAILQRNTRTPAGFLRVFLPTNTLEVNAPSTANSPVWRYTSIHWRFLKGDLEETVRKAANAVQEVKPGPPADLELVDDPESRLDLELQAMLGGAPGKAEVRPVLITVVGDIDPQRTMQLLEKAFPEKPGRMGDLRLSLKNEQKTVRIPGKAQSQFGYGVLAPFPASKDAYAYHALLYIMTHGYGGRLGKELIHRKGLIYYISNQYHSDGVASWIFIRFGVNPDQLQQTVSEFTRLMENLLKEPPTKRELEEAKEHLIGRRITAFQSNEELSGFFSQEWLEQKQLLDQSEFEKRVKNVTLDDLRRIIPSFLKGASITIDTNL